MNKRKAFDIKSILEEVNCNICELNIFKVKKNSSYKFNQTKENLASQYRSSSESKIVDQLVVCKICDLEYLNPRIKSSFTFSGYSQAIDRRHNEEDQYRIHSFKRALRNLEKMLINGRKENKKVRVLDVGCAGGAFLKAARDMGYEAIGLEPSKYLAELGRKKYNVEIHQVSLESFTFSKNEFDIITFWDVLEHLPNPKETLQIAYSALNESGTLLLNIPMVDSLPAKIMKFKWPFYLNVHTYYFSKKTIDNLLSATGFETITIRNYWQTLSLGYILTRAGIRLPRKLISFLKFSVTYYLGQRTVIARKA